MSIVDDIARVLAGRSGQHDAQLDQNLVDAELARRRGLRPDASPTTNRDVARAQHAIQRAATRIPELEEDVNALPVDRPTAPQLLALALAIVAFFIIETYGALLVMRLREVPPGERLPMAIGLAAFMVFVTSQLRAAIARSGEAAAPRGLRRALLWLLWVALYLGVLVAVVVLRVSAGAEEDTSRMFMIADGALVAAAVVAPSLMLERLTGQLGHAWVVWRRERQLLRELRRLERERDRGEARLAELRAAQLRWDEEGERMRAEYGAAFAREQARRQQAAAVKANAPSIPDGAKDND